MKQPCWRFSLIELLVVMGIIALLCSLLLPALAKAKDTAKSISCAGNLKQLAQSAALYADDYGWYPVISGGGSNDWTWKLLPYFSPHHQPVWAVMATGSLTLVHCPADPNLNPSIQLPISYAQGYWIGFYPLNSPKFALRTSSTILHIDSDSYGAAYWNVAGTLAGCRHHGRWNSSFLDGHVELIGLDKVADINSYY